MKAAVVPSSEELTNLAEVKDIPKPSIQDDQILIKAKAYAINPTDWKHIVYKLSKPGDVIGSDVSGTIEEVGSKVTNFKKGDVVSSFVMGNVSPDSGAFAEYVVGYPGGTIKYNHGLDKPANVEASVIDSYEGAASITLGLCTVAQSFSHYLKLGKRAQPGDSILIWGGATATGVLAIQVAKLVYNLNVIATASPRNHEYLKELGADYVIDYNDADVVNKIKAIGKVKFALDTVSDAKTYQTVYDATEGTPEVYLDNLLNLTADSIKTDPKREGTVKFGQTLAYLSVIKEKDLFGTTLYQTPELLEEYNEWWNNVVPTIINKLKHTKLRIVPGGLSAADEALKLSRDSKVSAEKIVFGI
ncbi:hypothetical protein Cantr_09087 [Candida viswanathii]|jgi:NADPH:quinone reductase-like Zn-dependent oxidoreductase|uniref:Enoyl reductase (ER) domain-containing protein n=1 Tax=Candida viswanathii TaxID=5486 RepID=A0A367YAJ5_9ASCO|nr:hypothetical protein Cantr_09087 [Candida viswanathii]